MSTPETDTKFVALLDYLQRTRGFDFASYKPSSLGRRINKRMQTVGIPNYADYQDYLEVHPEEFVQLFNTILINVTSFFRDPATWDYIAQEIVPHILEIKPNNEPVRVWSVGCASGEEAYTIAMILCEAMGQTAFRDRVKIYATDVDEEALAEARQAIYTGESLESVPEALRGRFFEPLGDRFTFNGDLRRSVIFGRHDLLQDSPISRLDLIICRNTLMYFNAEAQGRILTRLHFALNNTGFLFLGKAELLLTHTDLFRPMDLKHRVFAKVPKVNLRDRLPVIAEAESMEASNATVRHGLRRDAAFDVSPDAQIVLDLNGTLLLANERARRYLGISSKDIGRSVYELPMARQPVELRPIVSQVYSERRSIVLSGVEYRVTEADVQYFDIEVVALQDPGLNTIGMRVAYRDVTRYVQLKADCDKTKQELETAYEELQSTNEEMETNYEEMQSTVEELETTNEELQSANEELETMNEELQSTNEELETMNDELRQRTDEVNEGRVFLESVFLSMPSSMIVLTRNLGVRVWNERAQDMWGLQAAEAVGQPFFNLDIGLPVGELLAPIRACLSGEERHHDVVVSAVNRRGRAVRCHVAITPLVGADGPQGVILAIDEFDAHKAGESE